MPRRRTLGMSAPAFEAGLAGRRVLVTGHSGFTGSWACLWLRSIGIELVGVALPPDTEPSLFHSLDLASEMVSLDQDIRDPNALQAIMETHQPDAVLHLAAQPLVRRSYADPVATFATNALGTAHVLEAARQTASVRALVAVTTDKVYRNDESARAFHELDALGGKDPYSASKAAAEMVIDSYHASFGARGDGPAIAAARAGNIIGGGDWSADRLIPDFVRALTQDEPLRLRYPAATRPWQHVLGPVQGYLTLLAGLLAAPAAHASAWNFGPVDGCNLSVRAVVDLMAEQWRTPALQVLNDALPEAGQLLLDSRRATEKLHWVPAWDTQRSIRETAAWYRDYYRDPSQARRLTQAQIDSWRASLVAAQG